MKNADDNTKKYANITILVLLKLKSIFIDFDNSAIFKKACCYKNSFY